MGDSCELCNLKEATTGVRAVKLCGECFDSIASKSDLELYCRFCEIADSKQAEIQVREEGCAENSNPAETLSSIDPTTAPTENGNSIGKEKIKEHCCYRCGKKISRWSAPGAVCKDCEPAVKAEAREAVIKSLGDPPLQCHKVYENIAADVGFNKIGLGDLYVMNSALVYLATAYTFERQGGLNSFAASLAGRPDIVVATSIWNGLQKDSSRIELKKMRDKFLGIPIDQRIREAYYVRFIPKKSILKVHSGNGLLLVDFKEGGVCPYGVENPDTVAEYLEFWIAGTVEEIEDTQGVGSAIGPASEFVDRVLHNVDIEMRPVRNLSNLGFRDKYIKQILEELPKKKSPTLIEFGQALKSQVPDLCPLLVGGARRKRNKNYLVFFIFMMPILLCFIGVVGMVIMLVRGTNDWTDTLIGFGVFGCLGGMLAAGVIGCGLEIRKLNVFIQSTK